MKDIIKTREECKARYYKILEVYENASKESPVKKCINGNYDIVEYMSNESVQFKKYVTDAMDRIEADQKKRSGTHVRKDEKSCLVYLLERELVPRLEDYNMVPAEYDQNGKKRPLVSAEIMRRWLAGGRFIDDSENGVALHTIAPTYAFSKTSQGWIDMLSALHLGTEVFGKKGISFEEFLENYTRILGAVNNRKIVPFYPRALEDVCAAITIYRHKTSRYYNDLLNRLEKLVEESPSNDIDVGETGEIYDCLVDRVPTEDKSGCERLVCEYVRANPEKFGIKRYAQVFSKSLSTLMKLDFLTQDEVDEFYKEEKLSRREKYLFNLLTGEALKKKTGYTGAKHMVIDPTKNQSLIFGAVVEKDYIDRLATTLRMEIILSTLVACLDNARALGVDAKFESIKASINNNLEECGLKPLDIATRKYCTKESVFDYCLAELHDKSDGNITTGDATINE